MMRLRRLDLSAFGHFTDHQMDFGSKGDGPDFHIIHGANEAGKTTLMEGYLRLLFGFPNLEPYAFKHGRPNLRVGGVLEIDGQETLLQRLPKRANALQNMDGDALPETLIQTALGGLQIDDYRKLLCLDDATIETGGEEISNSKGDIGRLLFSAAAGISDLSEVLDQAADQAATFYKKGGSKSVFAQLKQTHTELGQKIAAIDVTAASYRQLRQGFEAAAKDEAALRQTRDALTKQQVRLSAVIQAHAIAADLAAQQQALAPLAHYPEIQDIDPDMLVQMMSRQAGLQARRKVAESDLAEMDATLEGLIAQPVLLAIAPALKDLEGFRAKAFAAESDLSRRQVDYQQDLADMQRLIAELGVTGAPDPLGFVPDDRALAGLERAYQTLDAAQVADGAAQKELLHAQAQRDIANAAAAQLQTDPESPDLAALLTRYDAAELVQQDSSIGQNLARLRAEIAECLAALGLPGQRFDVVPPATIAAAEAGKLAQDIGLAQAQEQSANAAEIAARVDLDQARARQAAMVESAGGIEYAAAADLRQTRDRLWDQHRDTLTANTADVFAKAMAQDDSATARRLGQAGDLAALQQVRIKVAEAEAALQSASEHSARAQAALAGLNARFKGYLADSGLPDTVSPSGFVDWLRLCELARRAEAAFTRAEAAASGHFAEAKALAAALAAALDMPDVGLAGSYRLARAKVEAQQEQARQIAAAKDDLARETAAVAVRQKAVVRCQDALAAALAARRTQVKTCLPDLPDTEGENPLPGLRKLRQISERAVLHQRQISGMCADQTLFSDRLAPLQAVVSGCDGLAPLAAFAKLSALVQQAEGAEEKRHALQSKRDELGQTCRQINAELLEMEQQLRQLAKGFSDSIVTDTLEDLRQAVQRAKQAVDLRAEVNRLTVELIARLGVETPETAVETLAETPLEQAEGDSLLIAADLEQAHLAVEVAIAATATAKSALNAVDGDADVAELTQQRRTVEAEMQAGVLKYLEVRLGHNLAERAIRRYRDKHRSAMMRDTEKAFEVLTNGAYRQLKTQPDGAAEVLVAITAGGAAKQAHAMSKGTRFQLYLALRAAAYEQIATNGLVLPFFCDDVFETFDETRTRAACALMRQIGQRGQAIYLTHHQHVVDIAKELCGDELQVHQLQTSAALSEI